VILTLQFIIFDILPSLFAIVIAIIIVVFGNRNVPSIRRLFLKKGSFTDPRDRQVYKTVKIGNQIWMAENLNYNADGCKQAEYGKRYFWETAKVACPEGLHLPSDEEWHTLIDFAVGKNVAGWKLKSAKVWSGLNPSNEQLEKLVDIAGKADNIAERRKLKIGWRNYFIPSRGTDAYGFCALPCGEFFNFGWWSATKYTIFNFEEYSNKVHHTPSYNRRDGYNGGFSLTVRCVKD